MNHEQHDNLRDSGLQFKLATINAVNDSHSIRSPYVVTHDTNERESWRPGVPPSVIVNDQERQARPHMPHASGHNHSNRHSRGKRPGSRQHERGSSSQSQMHLANSTSANNGPDLGLRNTGQRLAIEVQQPSSPDIQCNNDQKHHDTPRDYIDCFCNKCNERNRSIYLRFERYFPKGTPNYHPLDLQAKLKWSLADRYGLIEEVFPLPSNSRDVGEAFIIRHVSSIEHVCWIS